VGAPNVGRALEALGLLRTFGIPVAALSLIDGAAGFANAAGIDAISLTPTVAFIHHDATVGPRQSAAPPAAAPPDQVSAVYPSVVNADQVRQQGIDGSGVTVAILDSGVAADADLVQPANRILASVNFADERLTSDPGGHGTHIAGIIAGNGSRSGGEIIGVAPQANIVDVRVLGNTGRGRISSVVRGIEWVLAHRHDYNIRVINLSFGAPALLPYRLDPMSAAVEIAWRRGLVVVAASGNGGPQGGTVVTPGIDPYVITVGATDDRGTLRRPARLVLRLGQRRLECQARSGRTRAAPCLPARAGELPGYAVPRAHRGGAERIDVLPPHRNVDGDRRRVGRRRAPPGAPAESHPGSGQGDPCRNHAAVRAGQRSNPPRSKCGWQRTTQRVRRRERGACGGAQYRASAGRVRAERNPICGALGLRQSRAAAR
ncbi:MAG: hypothetical protein E6H47_03760, partial [Betaproteobacteria bacterium]